MADPPERRFAVRLDKPPSVEKPDWKEYYYVQDLITAFNKDCLEIKKWSVATASIVAIVGQGGLRNLPLVLMTIIVLALVFWMTETIWRMNQWAFILYVRELEVKKGAPRISGKWAEAYLGCSIPEQVGGDPPPQADRDPEGSFRAFLEHLLQPRTFLPHGVIFGLALVALATADQWRPEPQPEDPQRIEGSLDVRIKPAADSPGPAPLGAGR